MTKIVIKEPHGYFLDADGRVVDRFANYATGERDLSTHPHADSIADVEYVGGPGNHDKPIHDDYRIDPY